MTQCQCEGIAVQFDAADAAERLATYRTSGPDPTTAALIEALVDAGVDGATLLDVGGGVGPVQHELLDAGVARAIDVEASAAQQAAGMEEAERRGHADRIEHLHGDLVSVADQVGTVDIVTLDRSVCCWPDMPGLVDAAATRARRLVGMVYPRDALWIRVGWRRWRHLRNRIANDPLRIFVHRTAAVEAILDGHGFRRRSYRSMSVWQVVVYERRG